MKTRLKSGGRKAGTPNKLTRELRDKLKAVLEAELEALPELLVELPPSERIGVLIKLAPYVLPKVADVKAGFGEPIDFGAF